MLLEHTLVLAGETVECGTAWQGWPSASQRSLNSHRSHVKALLDKSLRFGQPIERSIEKIKERASIGRVFFNNMDSVRWNQKDAEAGASGEKDPLLKEEDVRFYPHMVEIAMV